MRTNAPPFPRLPRRLLGRLITTTALATVAAVTFTGGQLQPLARTAPVGAAEDAPAFNAAHAAEVRAAQCTLNLVQRKGGQELKNVARGGLKGTDEELLQAARTDYSNGVPLDTAFNKDQVWASAKVDELYYRYNEWNKSLNAPPPDGYTFTGFQWIEWKDNPFNTTGLSGWIADRFWQSEYDLFHEDLMPQAGKESADAVRALGNAEYDWDGSASYEDRRAWKDLADAPSKNLYADDARLFLQYGGFPATAPDPASMEFRIDVEGLKARFASCASTNPFDPHQVLGAEVAQASTEWQNELAGQRVPRDTILGAESQASADLQVATQAMGEALGQSIIASRLADWQAYWLKQTPASAGLQYPAAAVFAKVKTDIVKAQAMALGRVHVASRAARSAQIQAAAAVAAQQTAYNIADAAGLPRGRGLMYGQQAVQVSRASAAAATAVAKATETASNATLASAADSKTLMALAQTQAHASQADFRRIAAQEAAAQAKAAADGAAVQATKAAANAVKAKAAKAKAEAAEQTAKDAAADAHAKRLTAEAERDNAKTQKELAESERAKATAADTRAQSERQVAATALSTAQAAGSTATEKMNAAVAAESRAITARNHAVDAEGNRDSAEAKAYALEAYADAAEGTDAATGARTAATQARTAANDATAAATNARSAADEATTAASNAREAATRATAAASRAKAASDAAQRDVAITNAAVRKAHAAAADAIAASAAAAENVRLAKIYADTAKSQATTAKADAAIARLEANAAAADAVRTAGFAYSTAQAALAARDSATQVIRPANDAIELGSPYKETDASAGLAVLSGQAAKTAAQQQEALAQAKAGQAAKAATEAAALAAAASADAKAAATAAAEAAASASRAATSLTQARSSAAEASAAAKAAVTAETHTVAYDQQATDDAAAAATASDTASGYASQARNSADAAESDAASARSAATAAEGDASTARGIADQAERDATTAETAAANAREAAEQAQQAAIRAETAQSQANLGRGGATGVANMFTTQKIVFLEDPKPQNDCVLGMGNSGCDVSYKVHFNLTIDFYLCDDPGAPIDVTAATCPAGSSTWLSSTTKEATKVVTKHFSTWDIVSVADEELLNGLWLLEPDIFKALLIMLVQDITECAKGSVSDCLWTASWFVPETKVLQAADFLRALDAALHTGIGIADAYKALRTLSLDAKVMAAIDEEVHLVEDAFAACTRNSFPGGTQVLMADGSHRAISSVHAGDWLMATDPATGGLRPELVTASFVHNTERLVDVALSGGSSLTSTAGHRVYVVERGWIFASELHVGDLLRAADGSVHAVSSVRENAGLAPQMVYDLTVDGLHTFYVRTSGTQRQDLLVHNCTELVADEAKFPDAAHTLKEHVNPTVAESIRLAISKTIGTRLGINSVWTDAQLAQQAADYGLAGYLAKSKKARDKFALWMRTKTDTSLFTISGEFGENSLGTTYVADGSSYPAGNKFTLLLKKMPGHPRGYIVYSTFPN
ncbi:polymorphic toxin-type HINT domain-containing protein [Streptomyces sp. RKAG337]|uniref:polymorphic toxin-type HINT domain-containing protein n=1 Tax=Streptomyces sp. RKAG337 TaxID=2893404 RepID=UPI0025542C5C|nr:polymorphic toxin-type HINT domain-containing protein [Streptomyces sp. RKAG337]